MHMLESSSSSLHFQLRPACGLHEYTSQAALEHTQATINWNATLTTLLALGAATTCHKVASWLRHLAHYQLSEQAVYQSLQGLLLTS
jgi:hypothetical protein